MPSNSPEPRSEPYEGLRKRFEEWARRNEVDICHQHLAWQVWGLIYLIPLTSVRESSTVDGMEAAMKCNRCNSPIDSSKEAHVVMPNAEQCGFKSRRPTAFAHASCFERDVKATYRLEIETEAERHREIVEAMAKVI